MRLFLLLCSFLITHNAIAKPKMENQILSDIQKLLELSPAKKDKVNEGLKIELRKVAGAPLDATFDTFESDEIKGRWKKLVLKTPKSLGGVSIFIDLEPGIVSRAEIEARFGPAKYPDRKQDGEVIFSQNFGTQTLAWVFDQQGRARRVMIQDGR